MIIGRNFAESYYEDERLYSTGDCELDELLERAFCEGYEYAQREFAKSEEDEEEKESFSSKAKKKYKRHAAAAGTLAAAGGTVYSAGKLGEYIEKKAKTKRTGKEGLELGAKAIKDEKRAKELAKEIKNAEMLEKLGKGMQEPLKFFKRGGKAAKAAGKAAKAAIKR